MRELKIKNHQIKEIKNKFKKKKTKEQCEEIENR